MTIATIGATVSAVSVTALLACGPTTVLHDSVVRGWGCEEFTYNQVTDVRYLVSGCGRTGVFDCMLDHARRGRATSGHAWWEYTCTEVPPDYQ